LIAPIGVRTFVAYATKVGRGFSSSSQAGSTTNHGPRIEAMNPQSTGEQ
jgi:hypothetical protein